MSSYAGFNGNVATLLTKNVARKTFFIAAYTADAAGVRSLTPAIREIFLFGSAGAGAGNTGVTIRGVAVTF